ncbi:MAG: phosphohistidine phosphatase SixA [Pseudomonadota bacterium]
MKLYLVQHGKALAKEEDPERPLNDQGELDVRKMASQLGDAGVQVARIWHSGKQRAARTAEVLAGKVLSGRTIETIKGISPNDPVTEFASDADVWDEDTLVVGHLPFMSRLVSLLTIGDAAHELVHFTPGSVVCLERQDDHHWVIAWMLRPDLLPDK